MYAIYDTVTRKILATGLTKLGAWEGMISSPAPMPVSAKVFSMSPALAAATEIHGFKKLTCIQEASGRLALPCEALGHME